MKMIQVKTPIGFKEVLTIQEYGNLIRSRLKKYFRDSKDGKGFYKCKKCGSQILTVQVAHPIWDGPFPKSGSGRCKYESVPYCPNCELKPNFHGAAIAPVGSYYNSCN